MGVPHALVVPHPSQGHVIPLLELSYCLVDHGFKITFVNLEYNHERIVAALGKDGSRRMDQQVRLVSVSDGWAPGVGPSDLRELTRAWMKAIPECLEELIDKSREPGEDGITCMVVDGTLAWALEVARKKGLRAAEFWPTAAALAVTVVGIPRLIEDGIIDEDGILRRESFQLGPDMPLMNAAHLFWKWCGDGDLQTWLFHHISDNNRVRHIAEFTICNSFQEIELPVFTYAPKILPVGPLLTGHRRGTPVGNFLPEDTACMDWLDEQPANSVIYVAFGSLAIVGNQQLQELALGMELCGRPFLWVVRPNLAGATMDEAYPHGFRERVASRGRIVSWAPQPKVLAHPSVACFMSHCGWNSTLEGLRNGMPFLCLPFFADQFLNQSYICDVWKIGLKMTPDDNRMVSKERIKTRVEELLADEDVKARAQVLKEMANKSIEEGGTSFVNLKSFAEAMKS